MAVRSLVEFTRSLSSCIHKSRLCPRCPRVTRNWLKKTSVSGGLRTRRPHWVYKSPQRRVYCGCPFERGAVGASDAGSWLAATPAFTDVPKVALSAPAPPSAVADAAPFAYAFDVAELALLNRALAPERAARRCRGILGRIGRYARVTRAGHWTRLAGANPGSARISAGAGIDGPPAVRRSPESPPRSVSVATCKSSMRLHRQTSSRKVISSDLAVTYVSNAVPVIGVGALASVTGPVVASLIFAAIIALVATANNLIASLISPPLAREERAACRRSSGFGAVCIACGAMMRCRNSRETFRFDRRGPRVPVAVDAYGARVAVRPPSLSEMTTSTRRFCCRPDAVSLSATGELLPNPRVRIRSLEMPMPVSASRTASARRSERPWL